MKKSLAKNYLEVLKERERKVRVYTHYQAVGLELAEILNDPKHKSLFIKLAKIYSPSRLREIAKNIAGRQNIENKGAYFMKMVQNLKNRHAPKS